MSSSNQQSFSVSLRSKRDNLRNQLRREQLQQIFKTKRLQMMHERQQDEKCQMYKKLQQLIEKCHHDIQTVNNVMKEIKDMCQKLPSQKRKFFLIGSFLLKRDQKIFEFENYIIRQENLNLSNSMQYSWCLGIYCSIFCSMFQNLPIQECLHELQRFDEYLSILIKNYWQSFKISHQNFDIMQIYVICMEQFFYHFENKQFFPIHSFNSLTKILNQFYIAISGQKVLNTRQLKLALTRFINRSITQIKEKELYSNEIRQYLTPQEAKYLIPTNRMEKLIQASAEIFFENLVDVSDQKIECIHSIKTLCECSPINSGQFLFEKKYFKQYQFLIMNHSPMIRQTLLSSINTILPHVTNSRLIEFLDQSFHINLIDVFRQTLNSLFQKQKKSTQNIHSNTIFYILRIFQIFLMKIDTLDNAIFKRVFYTMSNHGFDDLIQSMGRVRFQEKIQEVWSNIVDTYFSEDVCDENHEKQNHCNSMNSNQCSSYYQTQQYKGINQSKGHYQQNYKNNTDHFNQQSQI